MRIPHIHGFYTPWNIIPLSGKNMAKILVAYASKKGSTTEIAQAIGKELESSGHVVDVDGNRDISVRVQCGHYRWSDVRWED
jgi:flavorubredoxin